TGGELAEVRHFTIKAQWQRMRTVHIFLDDRDPVVRQIAGEFELHPWIVKRDSGGEQEWGKVPPFSEAMEYRRPQAPHPTGALEFHQRGPVGVEAVKHFRVNGIRRLETLLVVRVAALRRELLVLTPVEISKRPRPHITVCEPCRISQGLKEPTAHDLKP